MSYTVDFSEDFRPLSESELNDVNGGVVANIGMGSAGATIWMAGYGMCSFSSLSGSVFLSAAAGGFVHDASGFSHHGWISGGVVAGTVGAATSGGGSTIIQVEDSGNENVE